MDIQVIPKFNYKLIYEHIKKSGSLINNSAGLIIFQRSSSRNSLEFLLNAKILIKDSSNEPYNFKILSLKNGIQYFFRSVLKCMNNLISFIEKLKALDSEKVMNSFIVVLYNQGNSGLLEDIIVKYTEASIFCKFDSMVGLLLECLESEITKYSSNMFQIARDDFSGLSLKLNCNCEFFNDQVSGHGLIFDREFRFLKYKNAILKPIQKFPKGRTEIFFYEEIFGLKTNNDHSLLKRFIPNYLGIFINSDNHGNIYIGLKNVLNKIQFVSVADIKLGQVTYEPDACPLKVTLENAKYFWRKEIGFLFTGIKVNGKDLEEPIFFDRYYGLSLDPETIFHKGILLFLSGGFNKNNLAKEFLQKINELLEWFEIQRSFNFYSTSLLMAYDSMDNTEYPKVIVKLIDFTHTHVSHSEDMNCIYGLKSLVSYFTRAIK